MKTEPGELDTCAQFGTHTHTHTLGSSLPSNYPLMASFMHLQLPYTWDSYNVILHMAAKFSLNLGFRLKSKTLMRVYPWNPAEFPLQQW